jgi:transposase
LVIFAPTLEERIPEDHPVRLLDEILAAYDWREWEASYDGHRGQPPIHPRVLAAVILYGFLRRIRSSRQLEYAVSHNIDFIWLVEGRSLDHSTIADFRVRFQQALKDLYRHVLRVAVALGLARLSEVAIDGTRVLANNNRSKTLTAEKIEKLLAELNEQLERALGEADTADAEDGLFENDDSSSAKLPPEVADMKARQTRLQELLDQAHAADKARQREGIDPQKNPAQIPTTDPDSRVLPNKEGGYAPNYTPMAMTDVHGGFIVSSDVLANTTEQSLLVPMLADFEQTFGVRPDTVLGDGVYSTGENLQRLDEHGVELLSPLPGSRVSTDNPAEREDPTQPVAAENRDKLPISPQTKKLDKAAFVYNEEQDCFYCPEGRRLDYEETKSETRRGQWISRRVYRSPDCSGCPLLDRCQQESATNGRTVSRDIHEKRRQRHAAKMATPESKARYGKRFHAAEVPFAILKHVMNLRRFLLRGLERVKTEWLWGCTAFNLVKLMRGIARLRAKLGALAAAAAE